MCKHIFLFEKERGQKKLFYSVRSVGNVVLSHSGAVWSCRCHVRAFIIILLFRLFFSGNLVNGV